MSESVPFPAKVSGSSDSWLTDGARTAHRSDVRAWRGSHRTREYPRCAARPVIDALGKDDYAIGGKTVAERGMMTSHKS